ncbi:MAG: hypothetical protein AAB871_02750 [Patescibacteria group bacterium]
MNHPDEIHVSGETLVFGIDENPPDNLPDDTPEDELLQATALNFGHMGLEEVFL